MPRDIRKDGKPKSSRSTKPKKAARAVASSNVTDETIQHHLKPILAAHGELKKAQTAQKLASGAYRNALKEAKKDGIPPGAITAAIALQNGEHAEVKIRSQFTRRVLACMNSPLAAIYSEQIDLFDGDGAPAAAAQVNGSEDAAFAQGEQAGLDGEDAGHNPYHATSQEWRAWARGWDEGQKQLAGEVFDKPKPNGSAEAHAGA